MGVSVYFFYFLAVVFFLVAVFFFAPPRGFLALSAFSFSRLGPFMFTQMRHGPRAVETMTSGAPHSSHTSPVAVISPRWGNG